MTCLYMFSGGQMCSRLCTFTFQCAAIMLSVLMVCITAETCMLQPPSTKHVCLVDGETVSMVLLGTLNDPTLL